MHGETVVDPSLFLINVAVILIFTKIGGMLSKRLGVPSVLGQVLTGVILGQSILGFIKPDIFLEEVGQIGVILLMFLAGLDTNLHEMRTVGTKSLLVACGGLLVPFIGGILISLAFHMNIHQALLVGTILTATSVSITVQTLLEMGKLKTPEGNTVIAAAVIDDVLGIIVLALVVGAGSNTSFFRLMGLIALFFVGIILFGRFIFPYLIDLYAKHDIREGRVTLALACCLFFAWLADKMRVATIIGAYIMGLFVGRTKIKKLVGERIEIIGYTFFIPIFFLGIGAKANLQQINTSSLVFAGVMVLTAILAKIIGSIIGALIGGFNLRQSYRIGVGMIARGEVALIITSMGFRKGIIGNDVFSGTILLVLVSSIVTPLLLTAAFKEKPVQKEIPVSGL